jgi:hypothetical protein
MTGPGRPPRLLTAALAAAARGWPVFPLHPGSKRPALSGWQHAATCNPDLLTRWWQRAPYNIGIACGPAALLVVDLDGLASPADLAGGGESRALLAELAARAGAPDPGQTFTVATPHGEHRYFTVAPDQPGRSTVGALGRHIDTRAAGGFVVAAGSTRRVGGRRAHYRVTNPAAAVAAPAWLLHALAPRPAPSMGHHPSRVRSGSAYGQAALRGECSAVRTAEPGTRNARLFRASARLGELAAAGLLDRGEVAAALHTASSAHVGVDGFTAAEAARTIANGLRHGARPERVATAS